MTPMHADRAASAAPSPSVPALRRACACGGTPGPTGECDACRKKRLGLQRRASAAAPSLAPPIVHGVLRAPGRPLDAGTRAEMEPRFRHSFADVRIHADAEAAASARAVGAHAYTVGRHVVFGAGRYAPGSAEGRRLMAHELAHVVQQRGAHASIQPRLEVGAVDDPAEREADRVADAVLRGGRAKVGTGEPPRLARREDDAPGTSTQASDDAGQRGARELESGSADAAGDWGLCIRTPLGPGRVRFEGCSDAQLTRYRVLPESGSTQVTPTSGTWFDADGIWDSQRANPREWYKVSDHCDATFTCRSGGGLRIEWCCNGAASLLKGTPHWTTDSHAAVP